MLFGENEIQIMGVDQSLSKSSQVLLNLIGLLIKTEPMGKVKKSRNVTQHFWQLDK